MGGTRRGRALATLGTTALLVGLAACNDAPREPEASPSTTPANAEPSGSTSTSADPTADWPTVDAPGKRTEALQPADVLVFSPQHPLDQDMVRRIEKLEGVEATALFSMGQAVIENRAIDVAAVDPATYRLFTPQSTADSQETWKRVAGGELALTPELQKKLPITEDGYLRLGTTDDAPAPHVGAYAPQGETTVEAVVNSAWTDELGFEEGNALLVSTGSTSPQSLRKPIERIVGDHASIQALDAVARFGLDPDARLKAYLVGSVADAVGVFTYTPIGGGRIAPDPAWVRAHIETRTMPIIGPMTCNKAIFPQLEAALREILEADLADELHPEQYAGCYYPRFIAGSTTLSNHSFGLAMDFNVPGNQRGTAGEMHRGIVAIFKKWGFAWGGDWAYTDPMHFEADRLVNPR